MREILEPGDRILDRAGNVAVHHPDSSGIAYHPFSLNGYFKRVLDGEISAEECAKTLGHYVDIQMAYKFDLALPEGATIVPDFDQQLRLDPLERLNLKVLPLFTNDPR